MKVSIIGTGYVGLVTGVCLAERGTNVVCVDVDRGKVEAILRGVSPIVEADLEGLLQRNLGGRFSATTDLPAAVLDSDLTMIAVGTPFDGLEIDLGAVRAATREVGEALRGKRDYHVVVVKSTVVPTTTRDVVLPLLEEASGRRSGVDFGVGMNPEFLTEGQAVADFMLPDRIVLGGIDERACDALQGLYGDFPADIPRLRTNTTTAEMIKYASNALLATGISFANEISNLCAALGDTDVVDVMHGVHLSRYLMPIGGDGVAVQAPIASFLEAGCGFGGSCLPKDVRALIAHGAKLRQPLPIMEAVIRTNDGRPDEVLAIVRRHVPELHGARVAVLGMAFKPDTDDVRESPAIPIVERLAGEGARVVVHDPVVTELPPVLASQPDQIAISNDLEDALREVDAIVLVTRWAEYREVPGMIGGLDPQPVFIDGRRMLDKGDFAHYAGVGL